MYLKSMVYKQYRLACKKLAIPFNKYDLWVKTANALDLSKTARQRLSWIIFYHRKAKGNAKLTCRHFAIHRSQFYYWFNRFNKNNIFSLENKSTTPNNVRRKEITSVQEQQAISLRKKHMHWGKMKLERLYEKQYQKKLSSWHFQKVIQTYKFYPKPAQNAGIQVKRQKALKKKRITELRRKKPIFGYLLHFDTIEIHWNGFKRYIITMIDEFTKMTFARMYATNSSRSAKDFLLRTNYLLDNQITIIHSDNGSEFAKHFQQLCKQLKIQQYYSRPRTPKDNPSIERFNQTLQKEWLRDGNFTTNINLFNSRLKEFLIEYNFVRPHETLDYLTPVEFAVKYKQLSEMYPSSTKS